MKAKKVNLSDPKTHWLDLVEDEATWVLERRKRFQMIVFRAIVAYLVLFLGSGLLMSFLGVHPLTNDACMPKALLVFVGLALLMALANTQAEDLPERERVWLRFKWPNEPEQNSTGENEAWKSK
jgi:hypothetical protein